MMVIPVKYIPKNKMSFSDFLQTTKVLRVIYDKPTAKSFFEENIDFYFDGVYNKNN